MEVAAELLTAARETEAGSAAGRPSAPGVKCASCTLEAESLLRLDRFWGPAASADLSLAPKPARGRRAEGLWGGGRTALTPGLLGAGREDRLGGDPEASAPGQRQGFLGAQGARRPLPPPAPWP